jgi:molybdopterin-guanine dinucleotide biosynthesis protein A
MRAAGFVLVGGHSSRMGRDKARLFLDSHLLVEDVAEKVAKVAGNVALVGDPARYSDLSFDCIPDLQPGLGPLAGIEAALRTGRADLNLIVACDMPGLEREWLDELLTTAEQSSGLCFAARDTSGALHPLCAVYRHDCLTLVEQVITAGRLKLLDLLNTLNATAVKMPAFLHNVNTPQDWRRWQSNLLR